MAVKRFVVAFLLVNFVLCSEGKVHEEFKQLSHSKLRALYAKHYDGYKKFVQKYKQGIVDERPEPFRLLAYAKTVEEIARHNKLYEQGKSTYKLGLNKMADLTVEEFAERFAKTQIDHIRLVNISAGSRHDLPETVDWVKKGYVTPAKETSCVFGTTALAVAGAAEAIYKKQYGVLQPFSAQELLDCAGYSCDEEVELSKVFDYVMEKRGLQKESDYPWNGKKGPKCLANQRQKYEVVRDYLQAVVVNRQVNNIKGALTYGPIPVRIYFSTVFPLLAFKNYEEGILEEQQLPLNDSAHTCHMLAVGYGENYIQLKASFGEDWGENGYIRVSTKPSDIPIQIGILAF